MLSACRWNTCMDQNKNHSNSNTEKNTYKSLIRNQPMTNQRQYVDKLGTQNKTVQHFAESKYGCRINKRVKSTKLNLTDTTLQQSSGNHSWRLSALVQSRKGLADQINRNSLRVISCRKLAWHTATTN